jgi:hypothetical protein
MLHRKRLNTAFAAALVAALLGPGLAQARPDSSLSATSAGTADSGAVSTPRTDFRSPDARDAANGISRSGPAATLGSGDAQDAARHATGATLTQTPVVRIVAPSASTGFDWGDASIGAGGALAIVLLIGGGTMLVLHRRHSAASGSIIAG